MIKFKRYSNNPIISPKGDSWLGRAVFNPGAVRYQDEILIMYRAVGKDDFSKEKFGRKYVSVLGIAKSSDGFNISEDIGPVIFPEYIFESAGCEDARIIKIQDEYFITYTGLRINYSDPSKMIEIKKSYPDLPNSRDASKVNEPHPEGNWAWRACIAKTTDFKNYQKLGVILPEEQNKDIVLFPEKIHGKYVMYHRREPDIWIAYSDDMICWKGHKKVMAPTERTWTALKIGASCPPIKTEKGWLLIYHGVDNNKIYRAGAALFDIEDPSKLIKNLDYPILEPQESYELKGDVPNVVFPCGIVRKDENLIIYYGGADTCVCVAYVPESEFLKSFD